jgi:hypothetical protein
MAGSGDWIREPFLDDAHLAVLCIVLRDVEDA